MEEASKGSTANEEREDSFAGRDSIPNQMSTCGAGFAPNIAGMSADV